MAINTGEQPMPTVIHKTRHEIEAQREELLERVRMSREELAERAATYSLSMTELDVWHTIEGLDYLLQGDC
ncbi:hypothetical protein [Streptomyces sp. NPDC001054]